jgi:hypothetical protein
MKTSPSAMLRRLPSLILATLMSWSAVAPAQAASLPEAQKIDEILSRHWIKQNLQPQPVATDEVFLRRLYIDVVGRIPTLDETTAFLASQDPDKRAKWIDTLLASPGYASHFFNYFADLLRVLTDNRDSVAGQAYAEWVKQALIANQPYDQMVRELLTAEGGVWDSGAIGFYMRDRGMPLDHLAATVQVFLGTRIECAQCHNHPFDKWSQMDYYKMAAFTYGVDTRGDYGFQQKDFKTAGKGKRMVMEDREVLAEVRKSLGEVMKPLRYTMVRETEKLPKLPHDYQYSDAQPGDTVTPVAMFGHAVEIAPGESRAEAFAKWMTNPANPRFTTVIANRLWKKVMGAGLIEPVDEMMDSTVPVNAELMAYLEQVMVQKGYNLKSFLRVLLNSNVYQRMPVTSGLALGETFHFPGPLMRRMSAEQVWDSVVTLIYGNVDANTLQPDAANEARVASLHSLYESISSKSPQELVAAAKLQMEGDEGPELAQKIKTLTAQANEARKAGDKEAARKISLQVNQLRRETRDSAFALILGEEGAESFEADKKKAGKAKNASKGQRPTRQQQMAMREEAMKLLADGMSREMVREQIREITKTNLRTGQMMAQAQRASELSSPAPRGHFLRTFGQSDRDTIENANPEAAVPQALSLMNGPVATALLEASAAFAQNLAKSSRIEEKINAIYLSLLTRYPTHNERQLLQQVAAERGEKALADITHAVLNTGEFLFVR